MRRLSDTTLRRLAWAAFGASLVMLLGALPVLMTTHSSDTNTSFATGGALADLLLNAMLFSFPVVGIAIAYQQPRNRIGWLMLAFGLVGLLGSAVEAYARYGNIREPGSDPGAGAAATLTSVNWVLPAFLLAFVLLLFPDGALVSRRWRAVPWVMGSTVVILLLATVISPGPLRDVTVPPMDNPLGIPGLSGLRVARDLLFFLFPLSLLLSAVSIGVRFRRSTGVQRLQLKWLTTAAAFCAVMYAGATCCDIAFTEPQGKPGWLALLETVAVAGFMLVPASIGVAVLRYRLYGIDVVINKAVLFGTLASFITAVYVAIVVGIGSLVGRGDRPSLGLSIAATAVVAVVFQPVRDKVQRFANRLVYGARATPYEVLSDFADRMGGTYDAADLLPMMSRTVAQGVGARSVAVWLRIGANLVEEARWPVGTEAEAAAPVIASGEVSDIEGDLVVPVRHHGELLGAIAVAKPPTEPITPTEEKLLDDVAAQAGLVLSNVRLVEDLRSSRHRLVSAQDEERRRLERNLHDGAQQSLVSVALMLRMLRGRIDAADAARAAIDQASQQLGQAIDELRELARGIHPAILTDRGLGPALSALVERSPVPVVLRYDLDERPSGPVEGSLYFVVAEALTNVAKYARASEVTITVTRAADSVVLDVIDDGVGGADHRRGSGLSGLADRIAAVDGTLEVKSPPGSGTRLTCRIPVRPVPRQPDDAPDGTRPPTAVGLSH